MTAKPFYPWLEEIAKRLMKLYWQARLPHAFLISGAQGIGKSALVTRLEKFFLCQNPQKENACGDCHACYLYQAQSHPDYLCVSDEEKSVNIEDIREINVFLSQTPHQNGRFVVRMDEIHKLGGGSANALLKILEEPPENTLFLLTASQKTVLPTIKSRCFTVNIPTPPKEQILPLSSLGLEKCNEMLSTILSEGKLAYLYDEELQRFLTTQPLEALYFIYYWLSDFIRFNLGSSTGYLSNAVTDPKFTKISVVVSPKEILLFLDKVNEAIQTVTLPGINKLLIFESLFYQWQKINLRGK